jgi:hypothetical protein
VFSRNVRASNEESAELSIEQTSNRGVEREMAIVGAKDRTGTRKSSDAE